MGKKWVKGLSVVLTCAMVVGSVIPAKAAPKVKLSAKKIVMQVGAERKLTVKNAKKKAKFSLKSGKKYVSLKKKKKSSVVIRGKKAGKAVVQVKVGKKKLTCKVTVKKQSTANSQATTQNTATQAPAQAATATPAAQSGTGAGTQTPPAQTPAAQTEAPPVQTEAPGPVIDYTKDLTIDLTDITTTFTAAAAIDLREQLGSSFDPSKFSSMEVTFTTTWESESQKSGWAIGKVALAGTDAELDGNSDGCAYVYSSSADGGTASVTLGKDVEGKGGVGINIQPMMNSDNNYKWPEGLTSLTVTAIVFRAPAGDVEPIESREFTYDGLDQAWITANIDPDKPVVAMTFDDGPGGYGSFVDYGMQIQTALRDAGAHATFFYIGAHIERNEQTKAEVKQAVNWGFEIANHSYDTAELNKASAAVIEEKISKTNELLKEISGYKEFLFRAPGVAYSDTMYSVIDAPFIDVSAWSNDWQESVTKEAIVENVKNAKDGDIINMHSVHEKTALAVPEILAYFKENGIQVVSVSELFAIRGKKLMTGVKYSKVG